MKTALYVADVTRTYRQAIDDYFTDPKLYESRLDDYREEISKGTYRLYTTGFFYGKPDENSQIYDNNTYIKEYTYLGIINGQNSQGLYSLEQRNKFCVGDTIEVMKPDGKDLTVTVKAMTDSEGNAIESCPHPKQQIFVDLGAPLCDGDLLRRKDR